MRALLETMAAGEAVFQTCFVLQSSPVTTPPDADDEPVQVVIGYYDDWFRPDYLDYVLAIANQFDDYEHDVMIAAHAVFAYNFLNPN